MRPTSLLLVLGLALGLAGCKEKTELRELCAMPKVGERKLESESLARAVESLRKAEESEEIAASLSKRRDESDERRKRELASNLEERTAAMAINAQDDRDGRRKAILEVTAKEQETQKLSDEIAKYFLDIDRNEKNAAAARAAAKQALAPLLQKYGLQACPVLEPPKPAPAAPKP
jgi:hypothetical protein